MILKIFLFAAILLAAGSSNIPRSYIGELNSLCSYPDDSPVKGIHAMPTVYDGWLFRGMQAANMITKDLYYAISVNNPFPVVRFNTASGLYEFQQIPSGGRIEDIDYHEFPLWFCAADSVEKVRFVGSDQLYTCRGRETITTVHKEQASLECSWTCEPEVNNVTRATALSELQPTVDPNEIWDPDYCVVPNVSATPINNTDNFPGLSPKQLIVFSKTWGASWGASLGAIPKNSAAERFIPEFMPLLRLPYPYFGYTGIPVQYTFANGTFGGPEEINYRDFPAWLCAPGPIEKVRVFKGSKKLSKCDAYETTKVSHGGKITIKCAWRCNSNSVKNSVNNTPPKNAKENARENAFGMILLVLLHLIYYLQ